ncbi:MAG: ribonuclease III [Pseudomonadota bacterium]
MSRGPSKSSRPKRTRLRRAAQSKAKSAKRPVLSAGKREELEGKIEYTFRDESWLNRALTHPSLIDNYNGDAQFSNQRLEFLGDRILGLIMAEILITRFPKEREGYLTKLFHGLVSGETCAAVGEQFGLRDYVFLDDYLRSHNAGAYDKITADAVEALIAAIYRDGGLKAAETFIKRHWIFAAIKSEADNATNPKSQLSDWCNQNNAPYAAYETLSQRGPQHAPIFTVRASVSGYGQAEADGGNKQEAEMAAASALLERLDRHDRPD